MLIVLVIAAAAVAVSTAVNRRRPDPPSTPQTAVPQQLDRADFGDTGGWLLVLFSSETCLACRDARDTLAPVVVDGLRVEECSFPEDRAVHDRYAIDSVPTVVLADPDGVVQWSYLGAPPRQAISDLLEDFGFAPPESGSAVDFGS